MYIVLKINYYNLYLAFVTNFLIPKLDILQFTVVYRYIGRHWKGLARTQFCINWSGVLKNDFNNIL